MSDDKAITKQDLTDLAANFQAGSKQDLLNLKTELGASTKQDLLSLKTELKQDIKQLGIGLEHKIDTKADKADIERLQKRLENRIISSHSVNVKHHLETRAAIGELNHNFEALREGLIRAGQLS